MGGSGALSSAIILARSSLETCLVLSWRHTEEGRVVTRMGVRGRVLARRSRLGKGVVGAGVGAEEREPGSGAAKLTASSVSGCPVAAPWSVWLCLSIVWITEWFWCWVCWCCVPVWEESASKHVSSRTMRGASLTRRGVVVVAVTGAEAGGKLLEDVWTVAWYSGSG